MAHSNVLLCVKFAVVFVDSYVTYVAIWILGTYYVSLLQLLDRYT